MSIAPFLDMMNGLSTDALKQIQTQVGILLEARLDTQVLPGRIATYEYQGNTYKVRIEKVNQKSANTVEISPMAGRKVRVGLNMLKVEPVVRANPAAVPARVKESVPSTSLGQDIW